jgi:DNA-binding transcriptional ArsR family regulator
MPPSEGRTLYDPRALKALANPLRQKILQQLALQGPATSAMLARALDVTTGGTSYNLRMLAEHGFVEEVPERARGRERWWRAVRRDLRLPADARQGEEVRAAVEEIQRLWFAADLEMLDRYLRERDPAAEWAQVTPYSRGAICVTPTEFAAFVEDYIALVKRYQRPEQDTPPDARTVLTRFMAFPAPADPEDQAGR